MRTLVLALVLISAAVGPTPQFCVHALALQSQEREVPDGHWCQRPPVQSKNAHACACHQHDCSDGDPNHVSAHTDPQCLDYYTTAKCRCAVNDCP